MYLYNHSRFTTHFEVHNLIKILPPKILASLVAEVNRSAYYLISAMQTVEINPCGRSSSNLTLRYQARILVQVKI